MSLQTNGKAADDGDSVTLFGFWHSPFVSVVAHVLRQAEIPMEFVFCSPYRITHTWSEEHQKRNPFKKVPVLLHRNKNVFESQAIVRYLGRTFPEKMESVLEGKKANTIVEGEEEEDLLLKVDELTEVINGMLQGSGLFWIICGHYAPHPKIWNWSELNYECGATRAWMEVMIYGTLDRISNGYFKNQLESPYLLGTVLPTLPDIILFHFIRLIVYFGNQILAVEEEKAKGEQGEDASSSSPPCHIPPFHPLAMFPKIQLHYEKMLETPEAKYILEQQEKEKEIIIDDIYVEFIKSFGEGLAGFKAFISSRMPPKA